MGEEVGFFNSTATKAIKPLGWVGNYSTASDTASGAWQLGSSAINGSSLGLSSDIAGKAVANLTSNYANLTPTITNAASQAGQLTLNLGEKSVDVLSKNADALNANSFGNTLQGVGSIIGGIANLTNAGMSIWSGIKNYRLAKDQLDLAKKQWETENTRYNERESERKAADAAANASAARSYAEVQEQKAQNSAQAQATPQTQSELPTQRS